MRLVRIDYSVTTEGTGTASHRLAIDGIAVGPRVLTNGYASGHQFVILPIAPNAQLSIQSSPIVGVSTIKMEDTSIAITRV